MAAYNRWQNSNLYAAAATLSNAERKQERGAFFGSIHGTRTISYGGSNLTEPFYPGGATDGLHDG